MGIRFFLFARPACQKGNYQLILSSDAFATDHPSEMQESEKRAVREEDMASEQKSIFHTDRHMYLTTYLGCDQRQPVFCG